MMTRKKRMICNSLKLQIKTQSVSYLWTERSKIVPMMCYHWLLRQHKPFGLGPPLIDRKHKLLYALIPKNTCTVFKTLFYGIHSNISHGLNYYYLKKNIHAFTSWKFRHSHRKRNIFFLENMAEYVSILQDEEWTKFIIIRDPIARLLSAFNDKCVHRNEYCTEIIHNASLNNVTKGFEMFVNWIKPNIMNESASKWEINGQQRHFGLQLYFGLVDVYLPYFDYIILYEKATIARLAKLMLDDMNYGEYFYHWNEQWVLNETLMRNQAH
eukprot:606732_1